jgi:hypothetical protein
MKKNEYDIALFLIVVSAANGIGIPASNILGNNFGVLTPKALPIALLTVEVSGVVMIR